MRGFAVEYFLRIGMSLVLERISSVIGQKAAGLLKVVIECQKLRDERKRQLAIPAGSNDYEDLGILRQRC